jgi:hypothetical protein
MLYLLSVNGRNVASKTIFTFIQKNFTPVLMAILCCQKEIYNCVNTGMIITGNM